MRTKVKKLTSVILAVVMMLGILTIVPLTVSAATYGDFEYTLEDDYTCTITGYNGSAANVTIPSTIYGYKVSALSDTAFLSNKNIRSVIIPNGVLRIGALCFDSCTNLQEITIPDSVMHIVRSGDAGSGGFLQFCDSLKEITLGSGLENFFDTYDLNGSHSFECIDISKNNKYYCSIDGVAFSKDKKKLLKYPPAKKDEIYTIPDTVSKLSMPMGFTLNENLKAVIIPKSVKEISLYTFGTSLNSIYGYKGTVAETYAKENGFKFIEISEPTSVSLNKTALTLDVGKSYTLTKTVSPSNAVTSYTWSSSNTSVATVDSNGKVTAKKAGTATITVKTSNGKTATCKVTVNLPAPQITGLANTTGGIKISWNKVDGAYGYRLYYKPVSGGWKRFKDTTATSFTDSGVVPNKTETYTIRCIDKNGNTVSGFNSKGWSKKYTPVAPTISKLENTSGGIKLTWNKIAGVYGYRLYYRPASGGWKRFKDTTATTYTDAAVKSGRTETYTIRCIDKNGNTVSGYNSKGWSKKYVYNPPKSIKLNKTSAYIGKKESVTLKYTLSAGSTSTVTWSSSNKNVATVSGGKVTAKGAGATTITATTANGKKATCKVTVINGVRQYYTCTSGNRTIAEYSVVVPDGCYDKQSNAWRCYYEKYNYDKYDMGYVGAILFTKSPYSQSSPPAPNFTKLGEKNGYVFGYTTATGLEFIADDITSVKKYSTAHQTFNYAVKTFRFE